MNRVSHVVVLSMIALSLVVGRSYADEKKDGSNTKKDAVKQSDTTTGVETAEIAGKLAAWARANKDPVGLATAARVLAANAPKDMKDPKKEAKGDAKPGDKTDSPAFSPESLLKEAKDMAKDNKDVLAAIDGIEKTMPETRGHPGGALVDHDVLAPGGTMTYTITFTGGEPMEIAVFANGGGTIEWHVYDENGNEIQSQASDHFYNTPKWSGPFKVVLTNLTNGDLPYTFATN